VKNIWLVLVAFSLIFVSCKDETSVVSSNLQAKGSVKLSLDKNTTPSNVAQVKVSLTKEGCIPITGIMNIVSDSTASLTLNEIAAGSWHVKVDAYNNQQVVVYSGETDANIVSDQITQLNLTLYSTNSGLGGIAISVTWSNSVLPTTGWTDNSFGPVMTGTLSYEYAGVAHPFVLFEDGIYKMWYTSVGQSASGRIFYATSPDGINWTKRATPVFSPSYSGFDNQAVTLSKIIKINGTYKMYYTSRGSLSSVAIGLATSSDGINWTRRNTPVLTGTLPWEGDVFTGDIVYYNEKYFLYYYADGYNGIKIGLATSTDGINFTKKSQPIIVPSLSWETNSITSPSVIIDNGVFKMVYITFDNGKKIGYAESNDGVVWTKNTEPIFSAEMTSNSWLRKFNTIQWFKKDSVYQIYYSGVIHSGDYYKIGVITKTN